MESRLNLKLSQDRMSVYHVVPPTSRRLKTFLEKSSASVGFEVNQGGRLPLVRNRAQVGLEQLLPSAVDLLVLRAQ